MSTALVNGISLEYEDKGSGPLVVLIMGTGSPGRVWSLYQVPALVDAGYRVVTFDNRGIAPSSESAEGMVLADLVADTVGLLELLDAGPARLVGTSMGSVVAQEVALARPDLVSRAVFMAAHARPDVVQQAHSLADRELHDSGVRLPDRYHAIHSAMLNLSRATQADPKAMRDWLDILSFSGSRVAPGVRAQFEVEDFTDRRAAYADIRVPVLVLGFTDDLIVPPYLAREVAAAVPGARYAELADCGHWGYLERPDAVNAELLDFFAQEQA